MLDIIKELLEICLFKKGPQDLPYSGALLKILIVADLLISFLIFNIEAEAGRAVYHALVSLGLVLLFTLLVVYLGNKRHRFNQTASALIGVDTLISFFALPGMASMMTGQGSGLAVAVTILLILWHWAIIGHIVRHTLDKPLAFGLGLAFLFIVASYRVMAFVFPELGAAT